MTDTTNPSYLGSLTGSIPLNANIQLEMSEAVKAGTGFITFTDTAGHTQSIDITSSAVRFIGPILVIDPPFDLVQGQTYTVTIPAGAVVDLAGNPAAVMSGSITAAAADHTAPTLLSTKGGVGIQFNEAIERGTGAVAIHNADGSIFCQFDITDTTNILVSYDKFFIIGAPAYVQGHSYYVTIDPTAITDYSNNAFTGVSSPLTLPFNSDVTPPNLTNMSPWNNTGGFAINGDIVLTYSENVVSGSGDIVLASADGSFTETIAITDTSKVTISGNTVTINPSATLTYFTDYTITIPAGIVDDTSGNATTYSSTTNFVTQWDPNEKIAPTLASSTPVSGAALVDYQSNIILDFSEPIAAGTGYVRLYSADGTLVAKIDVTDTNQITFLYGMYGKEVLINPTGNLVQGASYYVLVDAGAFVDLAGNAYAGISSSSTFTFTTAPTPGPQFNWLLASNGNGKAALTGKLELCFDKTIIAGTGSIRIYKASDNSLFTSIAVTDTSQVSIDGVTLTIDPTVNLDPLTSYYVVFDSGIVTDSAGRKCDAVTSATAIDFTSGPGAPAPYTVAAGQTINDVLANADMFSAYRSESDSNNPLAEVKGFANHGTVSITSTYANESILGFYLHGPTIWYDGAIVNDGQLIIDAPDAGNAVAISVGGFGPPIENTSSGKITVNAQTAKGIVNYDPNRPVVNAGTIKINGVIEAKGIELFNAGASVINSGTITVHSDTAYDPDDPWKPFRAIAVTTNGYLINSGTITCTADDYSQYAIGVAFSYDDQIANSCVVNSGTIDAAIAIWETAPNYTGTHVNTVKNSGTIEGLVLLSYGNDGLTNSGTIDGDVDMGQGDNKVVNSGTINGIVYLDSGDDVYESDNGVLNGLVYGGSGNDVAIFSGKQSDYQIVTDGLVTKVTGPTGTTSLYYFETMKFDDGQVALASSKVNDNIESVLVYDALTIAADETYNLNSAGWDNVDAAISLTTNATIGTPSLHNLGTINATSKVDYDLVAGVSCDASTTYENGFIRNDGKISVSGNDKSLAVGVMTYAYMPPATNGAAGTIAVTGGEAVGILSYDPSSAIENAGQITATATYFAAGMNLSNSEYQIVNSGIITVHSGTGVATPLNTPLIVIGLSGAVGIDLHGSGDTISNTGKILVTADQHQEQTIGITWAPADFTSETITNSGLISAGVALYEQPSGNDPSALKSVIVNTGTIQGDISLGLGSDSLNNTGTITGNIWIGADSLINGWQTDVDSFDGRGGTFTGTLHAGLGDDTTWAGAGNASYYGDAGNDVIAAGTGTETLDGGAGTDTLNLSSATSGVTASLAVTSAQAVGGHLGTITAANFENLVGSAYDDVLTGDSSANTLSGGLGNNTLDGGAGTDTAQFAETAKDYFVAANSDGSFMVIGRGETDKVVGIEQASFGGQTMTMADFQAQSFSALNALSYIASYKDLIGAFGDNAVWGASHYFNNGLAEGRTISFNALNYIASYSDLIGAFGDNQTAATEHYIKNGFGEGRKVTFDPLAYLASYGDLMGAFGDNQTLAAEHYIKNGYAEGRKASFNALNYIASYSDLIGAFGDNVTAAEEHYIKNGFGEGRTVSFDPLAYLCSYGDLMGAFGDNQTFAVEHYIKNGYAEWRTVSFNALNYIASYSDLIGAFGDNVTAAEEHYIKNGYGEGRKVTFDPVAYLINNTDLGSCGFTASNVTEHYINNGYSEHRTANGSFGSDQTNHALTIGGSVSDSIATAGDQDWFGVTLTAGQSYTFTLSGADGGNGTLADPFLGLYDAHGLLVTSNNDATGHDSKITFTATTSSTFYLVVAANDVGTGTYKLFGATGG